MLNFLLNVPLKYLIITEKNLISYLKNLKNIKLSNKPVLFLKTNLTGTTSLNPHIIIPKGDSIKSVLDARHLKPNTKQFDESWPIEPLAPQLARANQKYKCVIDLMYAHTPLYEETMKLTSFFSDDTLFAFIGDFNDLEDYQNSYTTNVFFL